MYAAVYGIPSCDAGKYVPPERQIGPTGCSRTGHRRMSAGRHLTALLLDDRNRIDVIFNGSAIRVASWAGENFLSLYLYRA